MPKVDRIRVAIADDHELFRDGLKLMLESIAGVELTVEAANGRELLERIRQAPPDVLISDIKMPLMDGVALTRELKTAYPDIAVIALSMYDDDQQIVEMLEAGASGYMLKNSDKAEIAEAIRTVSAGGTYYCRHTSGRLTRLIALSRQHAAKERKEAEFSEREKAIIRLICREYTNKQIGETLFLSTRTVEGYRMRILEKTGAKNIVGIVIEAIRLGIYDPEF